MPRLESKVALITGSSSGLGRAIALAFAAEGAKLVVCADLNPTANAEVESETKETTDERICREYGAGKAVFVKMDVTVPEQVEAAVKTAVEVGGRLDLIVNNAGIAIPEGPVHEMGLDIFDKIMKVNTYGPFLCGKYASAQFITQEPDPKSGRRGCIVNMGSIAATRGFANTVAYNTSKAAVVGTTKGMAADLAPHKVNVNAICPGFINTSMTKRFFAVRDSTEWMKMCTPLFETGENTADIAAAAVFLASDDARWITGVALPVDGGWGAT